MYENNMKKIRIAKCIIFNKDSLFYKTYFIFRNKKHKEIFETNVLRIYGKN